MQKNKNIHFEGDEDWKLNEIPSKKDFFYGWFENASGKILEAGCGVGNYVVLFSKLGLKVTGVEYSKKRCDLAKENCKKYNVKAEIFQGDIREIPLPDQSFDYIFCHGVAEHFPDTQKALDEMYRLTKKGGYAMISVPNRISFFTINKLIQQLLGDLLGKQIWSCGYEQSFTQRRFKKMLEKSGFEIIDKEIGRCGPGKRFPLYGKILNLLDKPLFLLGVGGGHFQLYFCKRK